MSSGRGGTLRHVPTTKTEHAAQHTTHIDVDFPTRTGRAGGAGGGARAPALAYIRFRNYYARSVTVRQLMTPPAGPPAAARWSTLLADYQLTVVINGSWRWACRCQGLQPDPIVVHVDYSRRDIREQHGAPGS